MRSSNVFAHFAWKRNSMKKAFILLFIPLLIILTGSCRHKTTNPDTNTGNFESVKISDYGRALFSLDPMKIKEGLDSLSVDFHIFIGDDPDTLQAIQIRDFIMDPFNRELAATCVETYPDMSFLENGLRQCFADVRQYDSAFHAPKVYTYISGLLYESPVEYADSAMVIGLDMFLGWDYRQYRAAGIPVYLTRRMERQNIVPECARQIALSFVPEKYEPKSLLDFMLMHGKVLYAMDLFLPGTPDSLKIGYTAGQLDWADENESSVWRLIIDQQDLYNTNSFINTRFIQDGPFTSGLPEGSPAMLGRYIGWHIIRSYMKKNPGTDLKTLFAMEDSQLILTRSGFKPRR